MRNTLLCILVVISFAVSSCSTERKETARFAKLLNIYQSSLSKIDAKESSLVPEIIRYGTQAEAIGVNWYNDNSATYSISVRSILHNVSLMRKSLEKEQLQQPFNQTLRNDLVQKLKQREEWMKDLNDDLLLYTGNPMPQNPNFPLKWSRLNSKMKTYAQPSDIFLSALKELRTKYDLTDSEVAFDQTDEAKVRARSMAASTWHFERFSNEGNEGKYIGVTIRDNDTKEFVSLTFTSTHKSSVRINELRNSGTLRDGSPFPLEYSDTPQDASDSGVGVEPYMAYLKIP